MFQTEWTAYLKTCGWEKPWYFSGNGGYFLWRELECRVCMSLKEKCEWMGRSEKKKKAGYGNQLIMSPCRSQVTQGFISHIRRWIFFPRKWRSFKGLRQVTDMTKFLFWNAHSDCRSASLEGGRPVSKYLKWEGTMVRTYPGCFVPQYVHLEFIHLCQNLWDIEIYLPAHWLHGSPQ